MTTSVHRQAPALSRASRTLTALEAAIRQQWEENAKPVYTEPLREVLAVHLRNIETLTEELREVIDAGGHAVDLRSLVERARAAEGSLSWMVESAARGAGLVAVAAEG